MNKFSSTDQMFMRRALKLARRGRFTASPNPCVGCVIVRGGMVIAEGWHQKAGTDHAEAAALKNAGSLARGADVYVTLEPCAHYGRTPPCAKALVKAGVRRVVAAVLDVNPKVAGKGMAILSAAGIKTEVGLCREEALALNRPFFKAMEQHLPYVIVKSAASLDGKIALPNGESKWITGPKARSDVQRLRARSDALITGVNTVLTDNPRCSVRYEELPLKVRRLVPRAMLRQPLKVVLDSSCRISTEQMAELNFFAAGRCLQVCAADATVQPGPAVKELILRDGTRARLENISERIFRLYLPRNAEGRLPLKSLLYYLDTLELRTVLVEAGSALNSAFIKEDLSDELYLYTGAVLLGGESLPALNLPVPDSMNAAARFKLHDVKRLGDDVRLRYFTHDAGSEAAAEAQLEAKGHAARPSKPEKVDKPEKPKAPIKGGL